MRLSFTSHSPLIVILLPSARKAIAQRTTPRRFSGQIHEQSPETRVAASSAPKRHPGAGRLGPRGRGRLGSGPRFSHRTLSAWAKGGSGALANLRGHGHSLYLAWDRQAQDRARRSITTARGGPGD